MAPAPAPVADPSSIDFIRDWWVVLCGFAAIVWYTVKFVWSAGRILEKIESDIGNIKHDIADTKRAHSEVVRSLRAGEFCPYCVREGLPHHTP